MSAAEQGIRCDECGGSLAEFGESVMRESVKAML